jgi:hypothetical protein
MLDVLEIGSIHLTEKVFPTQKCAASLQVSRHRIFTTWDKCCAVGTKLKNLMKMVRILIEKRFFVVETRATRHWKRKGPNF